MTDPQKPLHVAIIMDGNGRWAKARNLPRTAGHKKGADAVRLAIKAAIQLNVTHLTLFGFSSENWKRPEEEVSSLMGLLRLYLKNEITRLHEEDIRIRFIGEREQLAKDIIHDIERTEELTKNNTRLILTIALSYGSQREITNAMQEIAIKVQKNILSINDITEECINRHLYTSDLPAPDLLIRTSGEKRISNFLLWQIAYTEFVFLDVLWPDFTQEHFEQALSDLQTRERRYGMICG